MANIPRSSEHADIASQKPGEKKILVFIVRRDTQCGECRCALDSGSFLRLEKDQALCMECADLGHLEFLGRGDAAITRRATKYSPLHALVLKWSSTRKRYERQGILADPEAIERAETESLADAEVRQRRQARAAVLRANEDAQYIAAFTRAIRDLFPGCPAREAGQIASHACAKYSGRVGRSAAAREFAPEAIRLAVIAQIRHRHTNYDSLLDRYQDRQMARVEIRNKVDAVLRKWETSPGG